MSTRAPLLVALALGLALLPGSAAAGGESRAKAKLKLMNSVPLTVRGTQFVPRERVSVTVKAILKSTRRVSANRTGSFAASFPVAVDRCSGLLVVAVGSRGSRAMLKLPPLACPPSP